MKALRIEGPNDIKMLEAPRPTPGPDEVLVQVAFAGVCHTDIEVLRGTHGAYRSGWAQYPVVPGHEWSGWVRDVGAGVVGLEPGDLVTGETGTGCMRCRLCLTGAHNCCPDVLETGIIKRDGAMREFHVHPAAFVHSLGDLPAAEGALVEPASVGVYACKRVGVSPSDRVAVCGGGSIGQLCAQAARAFGARTVMLTSRSREKLELAERLGADRAVRPGEDLAETALEVTDGDLFDVTIEAAGTHAALNDAISLAAPRGRVAVVGDASAEPFGYSLASVIGVELSIIGVRGSPSVWPETIDLIRRGKINVGPLVSHCYPIDEYEVAFSVAERGGADVLKVLVEI